jgi:hypothetical protein
MRRGLPPLVLFLIFSIQVYAQSAANPSESAAISVAPDTQAPPQKDWLHGGHWFDLRSFDWPTVGIFTPFNHSLMVRLSLPMAFPIVAIAPTTITYASSHWGWNLTFMDFTIGLDFDKIGKVGIVLSDTLLMRPLPFEIWAGFPLNAQGMGIYLLGELTAFSIFTNAVNYPENAHLYLGPGFAGGIKWMISDRMEVEARGEVYTNYGKWNVWQPYVGITFKYRSSKPGVYGVWR